MSRLGMKGLGTIMHAVQASGSRYGPTAIGRRMVVSRFSAAVGSLTPVLGWLEASAGFQPTVVLSLCTDIFWMVFSFRFQIEGGAHTSALLRILAGKVKHVCMKQGRVHGAVQQIGTVSKTSVSGKHCL